MSAQERLDQTGAKVVLECFEEIYQGRYENQRIQRDRSETEQFKASNCCLIFGTK